MGQKVKLAAGSQEAGTGLVLLGRDSMTPRGIGGPSIQFQPGEPHLQFPSSPCNPHSLSSSWVQGLGRGAQCGGCPP